MTTEQTPRERIIGTFQEMYDSVSNKLTEAKDNEKDYWQSFLDDIAKYKDSHVESLTGDKDMSAIAQTTCDVIICGPDAYAGLRIVKNHFQSATTKEIIEQGIYGKTIKGAVVRVLSDLAGSNKVYLASYKPCILSLLNYKFKQIENKDRVVCSFIACDRTIKYLGAILGRMWFDETSMWTANLTVNEDLLDKIIILSSADGVTETINLDTEASLIKVGK